MNKYIVTIALLTISHVGYADKLSDMHDKRLELYEKRLDIINDSLEISPSNGFSTAIQYASECGEYMSEFYDGIQFFEESEGVYKKSNPDEYDIARKYREYLDLAGKAFESAKMDDHAQAFVFALHAYRIACSYAIILTKEIYDIVKPYSKP